jgi:hypothetical protein
MAITSLKFGPLPKKNKKKRAWVKAKPASEPLIGYTKIFGKTMEDGYGKTITGTLR